MEILQTIVQKVQGIIGTPVVPTGYIQPSQGAARIAAVINLLFIGASVLAVVFIIFSGINYISSGGDPGKLKTAQAGLFWSVLGLIIVGAAYVLVRIITGVLGVTDLNIPV